MFEFFTAGLRLFSLTGGFAFGVLALSYALHRAAERWRRRRWYERRTFG